MLRKSSICDISIFSDDRENSATGYSPRIGKEMGCRRLKAALLPRAWFAREHPLLKPFVGVRRQRRFGSVNAIKCGA